MSDEDAVHPIESDAGNAQPNATNAAGAATRRQFIDRLRVATALPVVVGLSLAWTHKANAY